MTSRILRVRGEEYDWCTHCKFSVPVATVHDGQSWQDIFLASGPLVA